MSKEDMMNRISLALKDPILHKFDKKDSTF